MMLGPVSSENEGAGSGTGRVRAFSLVILRAGAGVAALSRLRGHVGYPGGGHICSRTCGCVCWR